ncbi:MAG: magnesium-translocating P-type ATPase, partial [Planctomycetales bacterium]|nr:magnesium-translocating P-type ATPase [Planctomycetales bacterium]
VTFKATLLRDVREKSLPISAMVPGDIVSLTAGGSIPADCLVIESRDLYVNEAALTGETYPVDKSPGVLPAETPLAQRSNALFQGTHVVSGTAQALVIHTGDQTQFGKISERLQLRPPETDFERGVRRFGYFLMEVTQLLVVAIFAINVFFHKPVLDAFLFSLALAVGLTPQLLPAIISVNLSHGARRMAARDVIVRRLASIENFGSMNVLCSDKTGTLTQGVVHLQQTVDGQGQASDKVMQYAFLNASLESGFTNPIDQAIRDQGQGDLASYRKLDESPYDFVRKRLSVLVASQDHTLLISKGAVDNILAICNVAEMADGSQLPLSDCRVEIESCNQEFGRQGLRTLGVAYRQMDGCERAGIAAEQDMVFVGFLVLQDPPKEQIAETIASLNRLGVRLKMITGDNRRVAASVAAQVGLSDEQMLTGPDLRQMSDEALVQRVNETDVFAEVEPNQKERIILACKKVGNVVGYMGDGINDATALHAADVGISVDQAVDVAKEAADIVLLKQDLAVLVEGVREGRVTFANTMKYVFMATSANFGNMFSMAGASLFLSFLPLLPKQILLMNLLTDLPEMTIAGDSVDEELIDTPRRWDLGFIRNFMLVFGTLSSLFDFLTFAVLFWVLKADVAQFRTAWFLESVVSASLVVLIVRTRRPIWQSRPSRPLVLATAVVVVVATSLPWWPLVGDLGFTPLPLWMIGVIAIIVAGYVASAELAKSIFYRRMKQQPTNASARHRNSQRTSK